MVFQKSLSDLFPEKMSSKHYNNLDEEGDLNITENNNNGTLSHSSSDGAKSAHDASPAAKSGTRKQKVMRATLNPLPPRKRAKTDEEKEQRRLERIVRNREAAHASREKKRKHVEELEKKCVDLTKENEELQNCIRRVKESQVQMSGRYYLSMAKVRQFQNVVKTAKTMGDLSVLDTVDFTTSLPTIPTARLFTGTEGDNNADCDANMTTASATSTSTLASPHATASTPPSHLLDAPIAQHEDCTSPESLVLSARPTPSLSYSGFNSPHPSEFDYTSDEFTSPTTTHVSIKQESVEDECDHHFAIESSNRANSSVTSQANDIFSIAAVTDYTKTLMSSYPRTINFQNHQSTLDTLADIRGDFILSKDRTGADNVEVGSYEPLVSNLYADNIVSNTALQFP